MIQQLSSATSDPAFRYSILPRATNRRLDGQYFHGTDGCGDFESVLGVVIKDKKPRAVGEREGLPDLLTDPIAGWVWRDIVVHDSTPIMRNNEEAVQNAKCHRWHGKEVHSRDGFAVVTKECPPALSRLRVSWRSSHPAGDGSFRDIETQHQELSVDARSAPTRIFRHHSEDEISNLFRDSCSASVLTNLREHAPVPSKSGTVPSDNRVRTDEYEGLPPGRPKEACEKPEAPVERREPRPGVLAFQNNDLLPQSEVLDEEVTTGAKGTRNESEPEAKHESSA
jgi:hypothetical protein